MLKPDARAFHEQGAAEALRIGRYERSGGIYVWMHLHGRHVGGELGQIRQVLGK